MDLLLDCEICEENFDHKDRRPRFMRCGHSLCSECIARSLEKNEGKLNCPFCRYSSDSSTAKVSDFIENFTLLKMIDAEEQKQKQTCALGNSKSESVLYKESSLETLRQIEVDGLPACISSCNERLEELNTTVKEFQVENNALEAKKTKLHLEIDKLENDKRELNSKTELHESNIIETLDLLSKIESSMECLKSAKSVFGLKMAAQDIRNCKRLMQDWDKVVPYSSDLSNKKSYKEVVSTILEKITDEKLKKEADNMEKQSTLSLMWSLAHLEKLPTELMHQALNAHVKILDDTCSQEGDLQKKYWLGCCIEELKHNKWVLPALKYICDICCTYAESPPNFSQHPPPRVIYRHIVISHLQNQHSLVITVVNNLTKYMKNVRMTAKENLRLIPVEIVPDGHYNHISQVQKRLSFLRFLLKDGQLWLCAPQAKRIWNCLVENAVFTVDRDSCFCWFSKLIEDPPDLDPNIIKDFFESKIKKTDPSLLTENGRKCFQAFSNAVN